MKSCAWMLMAAVIVVASGCANTSEPVAVSRADADVAAVSSGQSELARLIDLDQEKARSVHFELSVDGDDHDFAAYGDVKAEADAGDVAFAITAQREGGSTARSGELEVRLVDSVVYLKAAKLTGDKFATLDLGQGSPLTSVMSGLLEQINPQQLAATLNEAVTSVEKTGESITIDGVEAQQYEIIVETKGFGPIVAGVAPPEITLLMFVGSDDLPRRLESTFDGTHLRLDLVHWGERVAIEAPPSDEVTGPLSREQLADLVESSTLH